MIRQRLLVLFCKHPALLCLRHSGSLLFLFLLKFELTFLLCQVLITDSLVDDCTPFLKLLDSAHKVGVVEMSSGGWIRVLTLIHLLIDKLVMACVYDFV